MLTNPEAMKAEDLQEGKDYIFSSGNTTEVWKCIKVYFKNPIWKDRMADFEVVTGGTCRLERLNEFEIKRCIHEIQAVKPIVETPKRDRLIYGLGLLSTVVALITWDSTVALSALILMCTDRIIYEIRKIKSWKEN